MSATPTVLGTGASFGFGDRLGCATPGHVAAMQRSGAGIAPIYAQQSIREMARTVREPDAVMADAMRGMGAAGWDAASGADADHLKTTEDVDRMVAAGFTFFTLDPSDFVQVGTPKDTVTALWLPEYLGESVKLSTGTVVDFSEEACRACAHKYGEALQHALALADHVASSMDAAGRDHEIELSVDETDEPTTLVEHWIIAEQCHRHGMPLMRLALPTEASWDNSSLQSPS